MTFLAPPAPVIVDASITVGSVTGDETALRALDAWAAQGVPILAPPMVGPETANALVRGRRLSAADVSTLLGSLRRTGIELADRGPAGLDAAVVLATRHGLSVYDATYLWLAIDVDGGLATLDRALAAAAVAEGVPLALAS